MATKFSLRASKADEWFTPEYAVKPILKYLLHGSKIWCPFDTDESNFVKVLGEAGYEVINTHIDNGEDFFKIDVPDVDYIVSNPPYSKRNQVLERLFDIGKPFAMLMNSNGLFDSDFRWRLFVENDWTLIYLKGRVSYSRDRNFSEKTSPTFQSMYVCSFQSKEQFDCDGILLEEMPSD